MNKNEINETVRQINELSEKFNSLMDQQTRVINALPPSERAKLSFITADIEAMKKGLKDGDFAKLEQIISKYASTDTKR